uniref:Homeobox-leucine zipper protein n=1 Tax=Tamarix hispida TaxID=189793 RepID=A0A4P8F9B8_9CARY|nr:hypothetical protein [Tamarix hispida]
MAGLGKRSMSSFPTGTGLDMCDDEHEEHQNPAANGGGGDEDLSDDGSLQLVGGEKKRRLNMEQVRTLEKNFELGNKLEPERKMQLAKALGLQPRQIAIWFQNRRARWKTKQLEKDYDILRNDLMLLNLTMMPFILKTRNFRLRYVVLIRSYARLVIVALKNNKEPTESINLNKENTEGSSSNRSENSSQEIKLEISRTPAAAAAAVAAPYLDDQYRSRHSPLSAAPASALHHHQPTSSMPLFPPSSSSPTGLANINRHINAGGPHHPHRLYMTMATHEEQRTFQGATTVRPDVDQADRFDNHHHHHHHQSAAAAVHVKEEKRHHYQQQQLFHYVRQYGG